MNAIEARRYFHDIDTDPIRFQLTQDIIMAILGGDEGHDVGDASNMLELIGNHSTVPHSFTDVKT